jgi:hypothetical protein
VWISLASFSFYTKCSFNYFILKPTFMKRVLSIIAITTVVALLMASCSQNKGASKETSVTTDTTGLAQFQQWKAMNERVDPMSYQQGYNDAVAQGAATKPAVRRTSTSTSSNSGTMTSTSTNNAKVKKGWSKAAKYSVIGGVAGGVAGAVINKKNRAVGAVIGGVLGAGAGYGIGRSADKKDGRY